MIWYIFTELPEVPAGLNWKQPSHRGVRGRAVDSGVIWKQAAQTPSLCTPIICFQINKISAWKKCLLSLLF